MTCFHNKEVLYLKHWSTEGAQGPVPPTAHRDPHNDRNTALPFQETRPHCQDRKPSKKDELWEASTCWGQLMNKRPRLKPVLSPGSQSPKAMASGHSKPQGCGSGPAPLTQQHPLYTAGQGPEPARQRSPGLCKMAEKLPERLARAESVLQPRAIIQLQSNANLGVQA